MAITQKVDYGPILKKYNLTSNYIEEFGNVRKIYTSQGTFALKGIPIAYGEGFINSIEELYKKGFNRIVPIYRTTEGQYLVRGNDHFFYLMPWLQNQPGSERDDRHHQLFKLLARLHTITAKESEFNEEDVKKHYESLTSQWEQRNKFLETYIDECEKKLYMSPFELQFASHFNELMRACHFARGRLDEWYEKVKETKRFRTSMTHGKVSIKHYLFDRNDKGYLASFEKTKQAPPFNDLVSFYYRTLRTYPIQCNDCMDWYMMYNQHFPLREEEVQLLLSYLTYPEPMFRVVKNYAERKSVKSEHKQVAQFLNAYWLNKNIEYFASGIMQLEQEKKEQQAAAELDQSL